VVVVADLEDAAGLLIRVDEIEYSISGSLKVILDWDASTDVVFLALSGQGEICTEKFGGLQNNAGTGVTGDIALTTVGWASGTETYSLLMRMTKVSF